MIEGLPSLQDSATFFETESAGPATANLEDMQQDKASDISSDAEDAAPADMDQSDLPSPTPVKHSTGMQVPLCWWLASMDQICIMPLNLLSTAVCSSCPSWVLLLSCCTKHADFEYDDLSIDSCIVLMQIRSRLPSYTMHQINLTLTRQGQQRRRQKSSKRRHLEMHSTLLRLLEPKQLFN